MFEVVYNKSLKIFSQLFVGVKPVHQAGSTPLAFATPYEDNAAGRKRQDTVKKWVGDTEYIWDPETRKSTTRKYEPDLRMVPNVPRAGFKVTDEVKRVYWGGGNVVWRVEDPDGWEVEIQSNNLMALIQSVGISPGGVINGECIWARDGAQNILIPVTSQEYLDAVKAAETVKAPGMVPMKERVLGRYYRLRDGSFGQYLGKFYMTEARQERAFDTVLNAVFPKHGSCGVSAEYIDDIILNGEQTQYEMLYVPPHEIGDTYRYQVGGALRLYKSASLVSELDAGTLSEAEILNIVNENCNNLHFMGNRKTYPILATRHKPVDVTFAYRPVGEAKFKKQLKYLVDHETSQQKDYDTLPESEYYRFHAVPPRPRVSMVYLLLHGHIKLLDGDTVYSHANAISGSYSYGEFSNTPLGDIAGRVLPRDGNTFRTVKPKDYHNRVWRLGSKAWPLKPDNPVNAKLLPDFSTVQELTEYVQSLYAAGALVEQYAKEIT